MQRSSAFVSSIIGWSFTASRSTGSAEGRAGSSPVRAYGRILILVLWLLACIPPHLLSRLLSGDSGWPRRFLAGAARICGARVRMAGTPLEPHSLLIANHVSWLDILVLGGSTGCAFVSKDALGHGVIHWLADQNKTIYVERNRRKATPEQARAIAESLLDPQPLALFPEGTVGPGDHLLPFRSALLAAVTPPPREVEVRPVAIDYGPAIADVSWHGESGKENFLRLLGRKGTLPVTVHLLPPIVEREDRKSLASEARQKIEQALASSRSSAALYARTT